MIHEFQVGGPTMWFLLVCIVLAIGFIIERIYTLFIKMKLNAKTFVRKLIATIDEGGVEAGIELCEKTRSPATNILKVALENHKKGREVMEDAVLKAGTRELAFLDRGMPILAGITTAAPFFGFLGTVMGMIRAFAAVAAAGEVEPTVVASGISEALVTTKWGLIIAAPLSIIYVFLSQKVDGHTRDMETSATELIDYLVERKK